MGSNQVMASAFDWVVEQLEKATFGEIGEVVKFIKNGYKFEILEVDDGAFSDHIATREAALMIMLQDKSDVENQLVEHLPFDEYRKLKNELKRINGAILTQQATIANLRKKQNSRQKCVMTLNIIYKMNPEIVQKAKEAFELFEMIEEDKIN